MNQGSTVSESQGKIDFFVKLGRLRENQEKSGGGREKKKENRVKGVAKGGAGGWGLKVLGVTV